jgi:hypothetical protein
MYSLAAVAFIVAAVGAGAYLAQRPTLARGSVLADDVHTIPAYAGAHVTCDDQVPITPDGADFACQANDDDGSTASLACSLKPNGVIACRTLEQTRAKRKSAW